MLNKKEFNRTMARRWMFFSTWLVNILPYGMVKVLTRIFIAIGFVFTRHLQEAARETLQIAFAGTKSDEEIGRIVHDCFVNLGQGMMEMIYFMDHPQMVREKVTIEGKERLDAALKNGKGVIAATGHFGNFPLLMTRLAQEGYAVNCLMRRTRDPKIDDFLFQKRERLGVKTIYSMPRKECVQESLKALRNNEILFLLMDQNFGSEGGVFVDFFGQKAATAPGPVIFAQRSGARIMPIFIVRDRDDRYRTVIEPEFPLVEKEDQDEMIYTNISALTKLIEGYIRKYPHEWGWMHRRWKTRQAPAGKGVKEKVKDE